MPSPEPQTIASSFGRRLKEWRAYLGCTQASLASELDIHIGMLKKYEAGRSMPSAEGMAALARTGVNLGWLIAGIGEMRAAGPVPREDKDAFVVITSGELEPPIDALRDARLAAVFSHLVDAMQHDGPLFWMPRTVEVHQCQQMAMWATGFLRLAAGNDDSRLGALLIQSDVVNAALLLGWKFVQFRE